MYRFLKLTMIGLALSFSAYAFEPFRVQDIRVEGLQRISPGTVFNFLPVQVGDEFTEQLFPSKLARFYFWYLATLVVVSQ